MIIDTPGVVDGMTDAEYHGDPVPGGSLSSTGARRILDCPARFRWEQDHPVHKDVFDLGSAAHRLVLGAGAPLAVLDAADWRTKAAKEWRDGTRAEGCIPLLTAEHDQVQAMAAALREHEVASALLCHDDVKAEQSLFWLDMETGIWCRGRLDATRRTAGHRLIITDYKSTASASPASFAKSVANFGYHQQGAFYADGVRALGLDDDPAFLIVAQEKAPPYLVTIFDLDEEALAIGRARNRRAIERYRDCTETGLWPGYGEDPRGIETIRLPAWAARLEEYA